MNDSSALNIKIYLKGIHQFRSKKCSLNSTFQALGRKLERQESDVLWGLWKFTQVIIPLHLLAKLTSTAPVILAPSSPWQAILEARVTSLEMSYSEVTHFSEDIIQNLWAKMGCGEMTRLKPNFLLENANLKLWKIKRRWIVCECVCVVCMCVQVYMSDRCEYECYVCIYNMCVCGVCICVCGVHVCTSICEW